jgi:hypothetical protein
MLRITGDVSLCVHFGELLNIQPRRMPGTDPFDQVVVNFRGMHLELIQQDAQRLSSGLFTAARRIRPFPDLSGITANLEDHQ